MRASGAPILQPEEAQAAGYRRVNTILEGEKLTDRRCRDANIIGVEMRRDSARNGARFSQIYLPLRGLQEPMAGRLRGQALDTTGIGEATGAVTEAESSADDFEPPAESLPFYS